MKFLNKKNTYSVKVNRKQFRSICAGSLTALLFPIELGLGVGDRIKVESASVDGGPYDEFATRRVTYIYGDYENLTSDNLVLVCFDIGS